MSFICNITEYTSFQVALKKYFYSNTCRNGARLKKIYTTHYTLPLMTRDATRKNIPKLDVLSAVKLHKLHKTLSLYILLYSFF